MKTINKVTSEKLSSMTTDLLQMPKRLLALACMACLTSVCVLAQSKFHVDLDYNYNLGLSQRFAGHTMSRKDFSMGGHALQLAGRYDVLPQLSAGVGVGAARYTEFDFIEAGIGSTGTTPGAFRLQHDILSKGKIDLLFVEAAVNDHTNGFSPLEQVRGMEGEVRHALLENPETDIVMLHFIYDPFIPMLAKRQQPDVILNHERVANHYLVPSVNLAQEISERMEAGEFTWEDFGGTHPLPFGHTFYAAAIAHLFDKMCTGISPDASIGPHNIPEQPLDTFSYYRGDFIDLDAATLNKGWKYVASWHPDNSYEKRRGFVDVPMLEATQPGDKLTLDFEGKAIGIFCTPGPSAGILEYSIDGGKFKRLDTFTSWSSHLYIPWVYMLETELETGRHRLVLRISKEKNPASKGHECQIRNFVVNR